MGLKYESTYKNSAGDNFKIEIEQDGYSGSVTEVEASAKYSYTQSDQFNVIRGSSLQIDFEADKQLDFTDLYSEKEQEFPVKFYINNQIKFIGFLKPDGIYTDYVNRNWTISVDCIDALGTLKGKEFNKALGLGYTGFNKEMMLLGRALQRTGLEIPINVQIDMYWEGYTDDQGLNTGSDPLMENTYLRGERFFDDDGDQKGQGTDCYRVIEAILEKYTAIIHQHNGEWWIYRPRFEAWKLKNPNAYQTKAANYPMNWFRYTNYPTTSYDSKFSNQFNTEIGSDINDFDLHHINANQKLNTRGSLAAHQVKFDYGLLQDLLINKDLRHDGSTIDDWNLNSGMDASLHVRGNGLYWSYTSQPNWDQDNWQIRSDEIEVEEGDHIKIDPIFYSRGVLNDLVFAAEVKTSFGDYKYWLNGPWVHESSQVPELHKVPINNSRSKKRQCYKDNLLDNWREGKGNLKYSETMRIPADAVKLRFYIFNPTIGNIFIQSSCQFPNSTANLGGFRISVGNEEALVSDALYTGFQDEPKSSLVDDAIDVMNGDLPSEVYEGVIKDNVDRNTEGWTGLSSGDNGGEPILSIMVKERIRTQANIGIKFSGDVYGYFDYINLIEIDGFNKVFQITKYDYDTVENVTSLECEEIGTAEGTSDDINVEITHEYTDARKPKIVG